jgi:tetratricopeptide (TPR) repeat protein
MLPKPGLVLVAVVAAAPAPQQRAPEGLTEQRRQEAAKHFRKGDEAFHSERFEEAEREFRKAIGLDPLMTLAHYRLGQTFMSERQFPDAVQAFEGCRNAFQEIARVGLRDAGELDRRRTQEINALRDSIATLQRNDQLAAQNQNNIRRMEDRVRELERVRQTGGENVGVPAEVAFSLGTAHLRAGSLDAAEREYLAALKTSPNLGEAHSNLAVVYLKTNRIEEAWQQIQAAEKSGFSVHPGLKKDVESRRTAPR